MVVGWELGGGSGQVRGGEEIKAYVGRDVKSWMVLCPLQPPLRCNCLVFGQQDRSYSQYFFLSVKESLVGEEKEGAAVIYVAHKAYYTYSMALEKPIC